jgi:predicted PurR-regulated permease PerM
MSDKGDANTVRMPATEIMRRAAIATLTVLGVALLAFVIVEIRQILLWVFVGIVLAIGLAPAVSWLVRHGWNRMVAALVVSVATISVLVAAVIALAVPLVTQSDEFISNLPEIIEDVFGPGGELNFIERRFNIVERVSSITPSDVYNVLAGNQETILSAVSRAATIVAATITILTIMVMLLFEGRRAWDGFTGMLAGNQRAWALRIGDNFMRATGGYVRGNLAISLVAGLTSYVVLRILGMPYAETLAVVVAILDIIPLVGATIGAVIVVIVGFAIGGVTEGIVLIVFFVLYQQFENNVLQNVIYAKTVALSPLIVFIAALIGASLGGIVGVLLAIPIASASWSIGRDLLQIHREHREAAWAGEAAQPGSESWLPPPPEDEPGETAPEPRPESEAGEGGPPAPPGEAE